MTSNPKSATPNSRTIGRALKRGLAILLAGAWVLGAAQAQQTALLQQGNAVVTGFSGIAPAATPPASGNPIDGQFIDLNGASARILDLQTGGQPPQGQLIASSTVLPVKASDAGQVFGITLDDGKGPDGTASGVPDIYLTATSAFGLQIVAPDANGVIQRLHAGQPGAQWMAGQWGDPTKNATPGSVWKISGTTGAVSLFANVILNGQPNSGPGLGNIAFDAKTRQVFVSDLETGMIHRFDMQGQDLGYYDHGTQGRVAQGLAPSPYDPANRLDITSPSFSVDDATTWHYAPKGRLVWGLKVSAGRLYYATADGPQVWSLSIGQDGSFGSDPRMEIDVTGTPNNNVISDVTFDGPDMIYLAQRGTAHGDYSYKTFADPAKSAVIRYARDPQTGKWTQQYQEYAVGFPPENRNTNGGVAIDTCNTLVWTTGELLRAGAGLGDPEAVHGLQGMDKSLVRPANVPPKQSYFADYDGQFNDPDVHGHMGDVEVWHPCQSVGLTTPQPPIVPPPTFNLTLTKDVAPYICQPGVDCKQPAPGSNPTDCVPGGQGWLCSYKIIVKNTGSTPYSGPLTVDDWLPAAPAGAIMTFSPTPPWFCTMTGPDAYQCVDPSVSLSPGDSVELDVVVDLPKSYQYCYLDNNATIDWPAGYGDADPGDDGAYASAHIPGSYCPPPQGNKTNLKLQKFAKPYCKPWQGAYLCEYFVWVSNTGPGVYSDKLVVADTLPAGDSMVAVSPPWSCVGGPPTYQCTHPPVTLNPGQGRGFFMWVKAPFNYDKPDCDVTNHAHITFAPGGSDENTNPGDDDASATTHIPADRCYGQKTNLKIDKYPYKCVRYDENGEGWDCAYVIVVTNTGPGVFSGPITVKDTFGGQAAPQNWPAPWSCSGAAGSLYCTNPNVPLNPGGNVWVVVSGKVDETQVKQGQCTVTNNASINAPIGSPQNTNPGDDSATATDSIPDPSCKQPVPAPTPDGHVSILKSCKASAVGAGIACQITVTNDGGQPINTTITFTDKGQWSGTGSPMHVLAAKPDSAALSCGGLPDTLSCSIAGKDLSPGTSHSVEIDLANGGDQTHYKNCAILTAVNGSDLEGPGHKSCVEGGGDISILKTGPATCFWGQACTFEVAIINTSGSPYSGPLLVGDAMFLNTAAQSGLPITVSPPFGCPTEPTSLQFNCVAQVSLSGHEQQIHTVTVQMPAGDQSKSANGLNCAFATDGSEGAPPAKATLTAAGFMPHAGDGPGYSCIPFTVPVVETFQKITCPGDEVRIGTQCQCPPGTTPFGHFRCQPGKVPPVCSDRDRRMTNGDCCPLGTLAIGNACRGKEAPVCQPPFVGIYPDCRCPEGSVFNRDRKTCVQPPGQHCLPPMVGDYPDCHCPPGSRFNADRQTCVPVTNTCPPPRSMVENECVCPGRLSYWNGTTCTRPPVTCTGGQVSNNDGGCVCPKERPLFLNGECSRTQPVCTGGQVPNGNGGCTCPTDKPFFANGVCGRPHNILCRFPLVQQPDGSCGCPNKGDVETNGKCVAPGTGNKGGHTDCRGVMLNGVCVTKLVPQPTETACPRPARGILPNCTCPGRMTWNGSTCVAPSGATGKTGETGGSTTTTQNCPKGQHWTGRSCAVDAINGGVLKKLNIPGLGNIFKNN